jgi:sulfate transport system permease protein
MPLQVEVLFQDFNSPAAFALASVLTMLAVVTLLLKVWVEGRKKEDSPQRHEASTKTHKEDKEEK